MRDLVVVKREGEGVARERGQDVLAGLREEELLEGADDGEFPGGDAFRLGGIREVDGPALRGIPGEGGGIQGWPGLVVAGRVCTCTGGIGGLGICEEDYAGAA